MNRIASESWQLSNQAHLSAALAEIKNELRQHVSLVGVADAAAASLANASTAPDADHKDPKPHNTDSSVEFDSPPMALDVVCRSFNLTPFERAVLLLSAGVELDSTFAPLCAAAQGDPGRNFPTFGLALAAFSTAHWSALPPDGPLRRWRLIEVGTGPALTLARLRIDERVLHFLAGVPQIDDRLAGLTEPVPAAGIEDLAQSHAVVAHAIASAWSAPRSGHKSPVVQLCATDPAECRAVAAAASAAIGLRLLALPADLIPTAPAELDALLRLWEREAALGSAALLLECDADTSASDDARSRAISRLIERLDGPIIVVAREPRRIAWRPSIKFEINRPTTVEQRAAWRTVLPDAGNPARIDAIASQFSMSLPIIRATAEEALYHVSASPGEDIADAAWQACRARCRAKLDGLAQRIEPSANWDDLVLPDPQMQSLRQIAVHVRHRTKVYDEWGFAAKSARGLGIAALFAGPSGTGKTMAAEVLAVELKLDLYRIDLATMVSKYIGETEKNLRKVFDTAEESGAILLFDEADALFGKRSEVKDSHDRYANIEVSYLLQRIEAYRGLAILTTNMKSAVDSAFLRRIRFLLQFPFPDAAQRAQIWRRIFPKGTPTQELDFFKLARLAVAGGNIRNIALNSCFLAAESGQAVNMSHCRAAAQAEYLKLERQLTDSETSGWV